MCPVKWKCCAEDGNARILLERKKIEIYRGPGINTGNFLKLFQIVLAWNHYVTIECFQLALGLKTNDNNSERKKKKTSAICAKCDTYIFIFNLHDKTWLHLADKGLDISGVFFSSCCVNPVSAGCAPDVRRMCVLTRCSVFRLSGWHWDGVIIAQCCLSVVATNNTHVTSQYTQQHNGRISWIDLHWHMNTHKHTHTHTQTHRNVCVL